MFKWKIMTFDDLEKNEIHDLYQLRSEVFVVEQNCVYLDQDGKDLIAWHILCYDDINHKLAAYARIFILEEANAITFGRVAVQQNYRRQNLGKELIARIMQFIDKQEVKNKKIVEISAQAYLLSFYKASGFHPRGSIYLEDDIPHIKMISAPQLPRYQLRSIKNIFMFKEKMHLEPSVEKYEEKKESSCILPSLII